MQSFVSCWPLSVSPVLTADKITGFPLPFCISKHFCSPPSVRWQETSNRFHSYPCEIVENPLWPAPYNPLSHHIVCFSRSPPCDCYDCCDCCDCCDCVRVEYSCPICSVRFGSVRFGLQLDSYS
jgi:hypothetical protein